MLLNRLFLENLDFKGLQMTQIIIGIFIVFTFNSYAVEPDWSKTAELSGETICEEINGHEVCLSNGNRENIYELEDDELQKAIELGGQYTLNYPVDVTRLRLPKDAMDKFFESDSRSALRRFIFNVAKKLTQFESFNDVFTWLGLHDYPTKISEIGPNPIPSMGSLEQYPMGVSVFNNNGHESMSFSCAACHSSNLFGVKVLGLTNRFPKANEAFILGKSLLSNTPSFMFQLLVGPSKHDLKVFDIAKEAINYVEVKKPLALGLDTSLAQVGLSLSLRGVDEYATKIKNAKPRFSQLRNTPADSKPAVWWNLKYKTKWLSDGSIDSGNPVHTNFLWNEIGRGVDLKELENWLDHNKNKVRDLTAYVFQTKAPKYNDFFPGKIDIEKAKRGEKLFLQNCKGCHGVYNKNWSNENSDSLSYEQMIETKEVWYHKSTINVDVGTDPLRARGMNYFYKDLNRLKISKSIGTVVNPKNGYTPPPLVGIWARWPYFHNNSVPTLYDVLTPDFLRPKSYIAVPADDQFIDFDHVKNGYPRPDLVREPYRTDKDYFFNNSTKGLSNFGHTKMMLNEEGSEKFDHIEKLEIIEFLKTL